jgi:hypothetical protein
VSKAEGSATELALRHQVIMRILYVQQAIHIFTPIHTGRPWRPLKLAHNTTARKKRKRGLNNALLDFQPAEH